MAGFGVTGHVAQEITLLCRLHHGEKTAGRLPEATVREHDAAPFNRDKSLGKKHPTFFTGDQLSVHLGNVICHHPLRDGDEVASLMVDDETIFGVKRRGNALVLTCILRDHDNRSVFVIRDGQLMHSVARWDVEFVGKRLKIRDGAGSVLIALRFEAPSALVVERAAFWARGVLLEVGKAVRQGGVVVANTGLGIHDLGFTALGVPIWITDNPAAHPPTNGGVGLSAYVKDRWLGGRPVPIGPYRSS